MCVKGSSPSCSAQILFFHTFWSFLAYHAVIRRFALVTESLQLLFCTQWKFGHHSWSQSLLHFFSDVLYLLLFAGVWLWAGAQGSWCLLGPLCNRWLIKCPPVLSRCIIALRARGLGRFGQREYLPGISISKNVLPVCPQCLFNHLFCLPHLCSNAFNFVWHWHKSKCIRLS
jgi:hypothetical protein